jgi:SAM-dependent methyltransferase
MNILLGCGGEQRAGWVHLDRVRHSPHVDVAHDLNIVPWPFDDDAADYIEATDVLEHLDSFYDFFNECWRILKVGGIVQVRVPRFDSANVWRDPTHKRGYHADAFTYLDPQTDLGNRYGRFYSDCPWHLIRLLDGDNILAALTPRKGQP